MNQQEFEVQGGTCEKKVVQRNSSKLLIGVDPWLTTKPNISHVKFLEARKKQKWSYTLNTSQQSHEI